MIKNFVEFGGGKYRSTSDTSGLSGIIQCSSATAQIQLDPHKCINQEIRSHCGIKEDFLTDKSVDGEKRLYVKECLSKVSKGVCDIDCIFGCHLISTTICHECEDPLQTTEFHIDLSLPMPEAKSQAKDNNHSETQSKSSKKRNRKNNRSKKSNTGYTATPIQAHTCSLKKSTKIPEVVSCQQKLNSHLEERKLFHCNYSNANDLKLKTDLEQCLLAFTSIDTLDEDNKFICQTCSNGKPEVELCCVTKQILIHELSPVLILHIKRFKVGYHVTKDDRSLSFPFQLDMAPFCTTKCIETFGDKDNKIMYSLYAVVEHNGSLHGGHYKAYVKRRPLRKTKDSQSIIRSFGEHTDVTAKRKCSHNTTEEGEWYCTDDSHVSKRNLNSVQHCKPFLLFYEIQNHGGPGLPKDSREGELSIATQLQEAQPDQIVEDCRQLQFTPHDRRHQDSSGQQREQEQNNCVNRVYSYFDSQRHNNTDSETSNDHQQISKLQEDCERQRNIKQQADNSQLDTNSLAKISPKMHNENQQSNDNLLLQDNHIYCSQLADGDNCTEIKTIDAHPHNMHEEYPRKQDQQNKPSQKSNLINQQMQQIDGSSCTKIKALNVHKETDITEEN